MWFFMILCYFLSVLTLLTLLITGLQGYFHFMILNANHPTFALLTCILYLFTQTLVIFYFVGIGVSIRDFVQENKLSQDFLKRSFRIKMQMYPPLLLNMGIVMVLFITGGAVDTGHLPGSVHGLLYCVALTHFLFVIKLEHDAFRDSTNIVLEMSGIKR